MSKRPALRPAHTYLPLVDKSTQKLPTGGDPKCPGPTFLNVRGGEPWIEGSLRFKKWISTDKNKKIVVLDIGSGFNTPMWVRWPAEEIVRGNKKARLPQLNIHHPEAPDDIAHRSLTFSEPANEVLSQIVSTFPQ